MKTDKIKIVHILEGFVGGLSTYMCNVLPQLARRGFDVTLICSLGRSFPDAAEKIAELRKKHIKVYIIPMVRQINPFIDLYCFIALLRILFKNRFDIVHTHCSKAGVLGRIAASLAGIGIRCHSSHCFAFLRCGNSFTKKVYFIIEKLLARLTTRFIAVSQAEADSAKEYGLFPDHKCAIVNNGLRCKEDPSLSDKSASEITGKTSLEVPEDVFIVTTACRLVEYKGIFVLLEAAKLFRSNCVFLLAGEGKLKPKIEQYIIENDLTKKVKILGHVSHMQKIYKISDVIVLCSELEGQPYLLLEAMRARCPIIATEVEGNKELLANQRGIMVQPEAGKIAEAVDELLADEIKKERLVQNAYDYFCRYHSLENQILQLTDIYKLSLFDIGERKHIEDFIHTNSCIEQSQRRTIKETTAYK